MESLISIIIPVYNAEKHLSRCIDSVLDQTYKNIEIILVNDKSTDNSGNICNHYKTKNKNIKVLHHEYNHGSAGASRNTGLKKATGEYIAFIDSDDWVHPYMMKAMLTAIKISNTKIAECELIETDAYFIKSIDYNNIIKNIFIEERLDSLKRILNTQRFSVCVRLYERSLLTNVKFPEQVISEDVYFTLEVYYKISKTAKIKAPFYYYFITPDSVTRKSYSIKHLDTLDSGLHVQKSLQKTEKDRELLIAVQYHILRKVIYHYKMMNYHSYLDPQYVYRRKLKKLIELNYFKSKEHDTYLQLSKFLPILLFKFLINLNKFKHKILNTSQFK